ncbi:hypothetical protein KCP70_08170 [Salmonella enterica subsp. enterica]|nr:hypothetical protein KCP70_08170 [Salmonella enterica subsp. enterica]
MNTHNLRQRQLLRAGGFANFDLTPFGGVEHYQSDTPPARFGAFVIAYGSTPASKPHQFESFMAGRDVRPAYW